MESEDSGIIERIRLGETEAYEALVEKYHYRLLNFIFRIVRDEFIVEDLGQEIFISVYRALPDFDEGRGVPFSAWLFIIARNRCISELRKRKAAQFVPIIDELAGSHDPLPDDILYRKERQAALDKAIGHLEEPFREALVQSLKGASIDEIARACNVPQNTVKTRLFRARNKLKKLFLNPTEGTAP